VIAVGGLLLAALACAGCNAAHRSAELPRAVYGDVPVGESAWRSSNGELRAQLFFTDRPARLLLRWERSEHLDLGQLTEVTIGEAVTAMIVFSGCRADAANECRLRGDYEIFDPDGVRLARFGDVDIWDRKPAPRLPALQLGKGAAAIATGGGRPNAYRVAATLRDLNAGTEMTLVRDIELRASPPSIATSDPRLRGRPRR